MQMRNFFILFLFISTFLTSVIAAPALIPAPPRVNAKAYLLIDYNSGRVLAEKNADKKIEPASLTKLMTAYVVFFELQRGGISLEDQAKVSEKAWRTSIGGSRMFLRVNTYVSIEELLKGLIIQSGNDAAITLAEHTAGTEASFVELMNQHAERLGMNTTYFKNSSGLTANGHYSTARDLATLSRAVINDFPEHYPRYKVKKYRYNNITQSNRNKLLWMDDRVDGLKTGRTEAAGYCLILSAQSKGMRLISVVTGSKNDPSRIAASRKLLNYGFRFFETRLLHEANTEITSMHVWKGEEQTLSLGIADNLYVTSLKGLGKKIKSNIKVEAMIEAPVTKGKSYGQLNIMLENKKIATRELIALNTIEEGGIWRKLIDNIKLMFQ